MSRLRRATKKPDEVGSPQAAGGVEMYALARRLYPICRSITGQGVRETLAILREHVPLEVRQVPSGKAVYDWEVPLEWNVEDAAVISPAGERVVDFQKHNLHLVSYSEPVSRSMPLTELQGHLHSLPDQPSWIPYRTSYYKRNWGFCLRDVNRVGFQKGTYRVEIATSLRRGHLTYGELAIPGEIRDEILFVTHICHPSLANDNTAGMAVTCALAEWLAMERRRYTYRFVLAPGTIGTLCWLKTNEGRLARVRAGLVLALLGDPGRLTYKQTRDGGAYTDQVAAFAVSQIDPESRVIPFSPYGYDERQLNAPGFKLPVGRLTRSVNGGYPQYHSSADDLDLIRADCLQQSLDACKLFVEVLEGDRVYRNTSPMGEPRLGKRGLYGSVGGVTPQQREQAMLWILNQADGSKSLLETARRSGLDFRVLQDSAAALAAAGLLAQRRSTPRAALASRKKGRRKK